MTKMTTGVLFICWGSVEPVLTRAQESVKKWHPELPIHVERLSPDATMLDKARMAALSPFDTTIYLDTDTVVLGRLDYAIEKSKKHGVALCINECPWARRAYALDGMGDIVEYNAGVVFFTRNVRWGVLDEWARRAKTMEPAMRSRGPDGGVSVMKINDQPSLAAAIDACDPDRMPFILPLNWNYRPLWHKSFFGPIRIWHDRSDPSPAILKWNEMHAIPSSIIDYAEVAVEKPESGMTPEKTRRALEIMTLPEVVSMRKALKQLREVMEPEVMDDVEQRFADVLRACGGKGVKA